MSVADWLLLISPFFFWGTSMAAMKELAPHTTPLLLASWRLIPAGAALLAWAYKDKRPNPTEAMGWVAILAFGLVDGACFQVGVAGVGRAGQGRYYGGVVGKRGSSCLAGAVKPGRAPIDAMT